MSYKDVDRKVIYVDENLVTSPNSMNIYEFMLGRNLTFVIYVYEQLDRKVISIDKNEFKLELDLTFVMDGEGFESGGHYT